MSDSSTTSPSIEADRRHKLWNLIKDTRFAMFTTRHANGHLHSRPMTTQNRSVDEDDTLWFFMSRSGEPVADIQGDFVVNVSYANTDEDHYVSVSGRAALVEDRTKREQLWNKAAQAWFPQGVDDPDVALVQVKITHASYWDVKASKLTQLYEMAKSLVTGEPPRQLGETGDVRMNAR
ncbi:pyridoxamine 5'-phosphate oxidase family protein [Roseateles sp. SL47]|uniref:pyridoxamine 5'-phosphate oxidase family protein n=1 Tax=Roseateles sp. SL47 TaxID=2995138 RepID=UPI00226E6C3D|nr:pyridoxamine 5'-phosphate oxidase family protein [Roseateles sp. SL47]WAC72521.1 pyridoxamine 5'-phosphate oxidase family protein [Roseateles sp. SL47]